MMANLAQRAMRVSRIAGFDLLRSAGDQRRSFRIHPIRLPTAHRRRPLLPGTTFEVPVELATTDTGFSYMQQGWHPYVETLHEYRADANLRYADSTLARLHATFQPSNLQEVLLEHLSDPVEPLASWPPRMYFLRGIWTLNPWLARKAVEVFPAHERAGWLYFGPIAPQAGQEDLERLVHAYESIRDSGFRTDKGVAPIDGYFLAARDRYRFVVLGGNHRVAALKVLGIETFRARLRGGFPAVVWADDLHRWTRAAGGVYPAETVAHIFWKLFNESGASKAANLGLLDTKRST